MILRVIPFSFGHGMPGGIPFPPRRGYNEQGSGALSASSEQERRGLEHLYGLESLCGEKSCVAFGPFDGLHVGHRAVIGRMAECTGLRKILLSFERPDRPFFLTESEKAFLLKDSAVDCLLSVLERETENLSPREFIHQILLERLHARVIVTGEHASLFDELLSCSRNGAFQLVSVSPVCSDGSPVSSALLNRYAENGPFRSLLDLLGHPFIMQGTVVHGKGLGRTRGMPTANLRLPENKILPPYGVYASLVHLEDGAVRTGLTNIGPRPSVDDVPVPTVETYILDFDGDLYGQELTLEVRKWIRGIRKFTGGLEEVAEQVRRDIESVRGAFQD